MAVGDMFTVGDDVVTLVEIISADTFILSPRPGESVMVGPDEWTNLMPHCVARSTIPKGSLQKSSKVRVQVNAPEYRIQYIRREGNNQ